MKYVKTYEVFESPFKSFNPYVSRIMKGLEEIYVREDNNIRIGIIDKNSAKLDRVSDPSISPTKSRMMVQVRFEDNRIKISINIPMLEQVAYLVDLCETYYDETSERYGEHFLTDYFISLDNIDDFIKDLTLEGEEIWNDSKKYNL